VAAGRGRVVYEDGSRETIRGSVHGFLTLLTLGLGLSGLIVARERQLTRLGAGIVLTLLAGVVLLL
jgi:hypothetical protein